MNWYYGIRALKELIQRYLLKREPSRQPYLLAQIAPEHTFRLYYHLCVLHWYHDNYLSYVDKGELYNIRKLHFKGVGCWYQTHIRIFEDGEVRGHYEVTPESEPRAHYQGTTLEEVQASELEELKAIIEKMG